jgi:hypothetical protein
MLGLYFSGTFDSADFVAEAGGLFVVFRGYGFLHLPAEADELRLLFGVRRAALGYFADVASFAVDVDEQGLQLVGEADVVVRAAEAALLAELKESDAADGAGAFVEAGEFFGRFADGQMLREQAGHGGQRLGGFVDRGREKLMRAVFAEVQLVRFAVHQIGDMEGGGLFTFLTFHGANLRNLFAHLTARGGRQNLNY